MRVMTNRADLTTRIVLNAVAGSSAWEKLTKTYPPDVVHAAIAREYKAGHIDYLVTPERPYLTPAGWRLQGLLATQEKRATATARAERAEHERDDVIAERDRLRALIAEYENAISWDTTCLGCAKTLEAMARAEAERDDALALPSRAEATTPYNPNPGGKR
jgi:hypothetical protein